MDMLHANPIMVFFVGGMIAMGYCAAALFFLRFWRRTRDRLFAIFAAAFVLLALQQLGLAISGRPTEGSAFLYLPRLIAFLLILYAIVDKNRKKTRS